MTFRCVKVKILNGFIPKNGKYFYKEANFSFQAVSVRTKNANITSLKRFFENTRIRKTQKLSIAAK